MVTEIFWQKRISGVLRVICRSVTLDGVPHTIVGILARPCPFLGWAECECGSQALRAPRNFLRTHDPPAPGFLRVVGRLNRGRPGTGPAGMPPLEKVTARLSGQDR